MSENVKRYQCLAQACYERFMREGVSIDACPETAERSAVRDSLTQEEWLRVMELRLAYGPWPPGPR